MTTNTTPTPSTAVWTETTMTELVKGVGVVVQLRPDAVPGVKELAVSYAKEIGGLLVAEFKPENSDVAFSYVGSANGKGIGPLLKQLRAFGTSHMVLRRTEGVYVWNGGLSIAISDKRPLASGFFQYQITPEPNFGKGRLTRIQKAVYKNGFALKEGKSKRVKLYELDEKDLQKFAENPDLAERVMAGQTQTFEIMKENPVVFVTREDISAVATFSAFNAFYVIKLVSPKGRMTQDLMVLVRLKKTDGGLVFDEIKEFGSPAEAAGFFRKSNAAKDCLRLVLQAVKDKKRHLAERAQKRRAASADK